MITHQSPDRDCTFIFPILGDVDILIDYNGLFWRAELSQIDSLSDFSSACTGFSIESFDSNGNIFIVISKKEFTLDEHIEIVFESRLKEDFPCAFYNGRKKSYDDFSIPVDSQGFSIKVNSNDYMIISSIDYDDDPIEEPIDEELVDEELVDEETVDEELVDEELVDEETVDIDGLKKQLDDSLLENDSLRSKISALETENERLRTRIKSTNNVSIIRDDDSDIKAELERLKTLVTQLADRDFNGDYVKTADVEINDITHKIEELKRLIKEKSSSLEQLKKEYDEAEKKKAEISDEISHTMDLLHKAESVQRESTTELSVFQKRLNDILRELQIDISTLEMYETQDGVDALILEANDIKNRIESKLKALISSRQKDTTTRFNSISS